MTGMMTIEYTDGTMETKTWEGSFEGIVDRVLEERIDVWRIWYTVDGEMPDTDEDPDWETDAICPRCGRPMDPYMVRNAVSRRADVYICTACGQDEAVRDWMKQEPLPFEQWFSRPRAEVE